MYLKIFYKFILLENPLIFFTNPYFYLLGADNPLFFFFFLLLEADTPPMGWTLKLEKNSK